MSQAYSDCAHSILKRRRPYPIVTLHLTISFRAMNGGPVLIYPQKFAHLENDISFKVLSLIRKQHIGHISKIEHLENDIASKVLSLIRKQHIGRSNSSTQFCTISLAPPAISVDTNGYGNSYFVKRSMSVKTKMCFTLVRFAIVTGHKMFAADLLNRILKLNGTRPATFFSSAARVRHH